MASSSFFSCYETIKLMDKSMLFTFPSFLNPETFESDMNHLSQISNKHDLKEFIYMIKLIRIKVKPLIFL